MSFTISRTWLLSVALLTAGAAAALAQAPVPNQHTPFQPAEIPYQIEARPFANPDLSIYGDGPSANEGLFFSYERAAWVFSSPHRRPIGNPAYDGLIDANATVIDSTASWDNAWIENDFVWGNRYELGYVNDDKGWMVSTAHVHQQYSELIGTSFVTVPFGDPTGALQGFYAPNGVDIDYNGNGVFGNTLPFNFDLGSPNPMPPPPIIPPPDGILDTYVGPDFGDFLTYFPIFFEEVTVTNRSRWSNVEVMHIDRWNPLHNGGVLEWLVGVRYSQFTDEYTFNGFNPSFLPDRVYQIGQWNTKINNNLVGPQIGLRWNRQVGRWSVGAESRFAPMVNIQSGRLDGRLTKLVGNDSPFSNSSEFYDSDTAHTFAPLGEFRLNTGIQVTQAISLQMGYTCTIVGGIGRATNRTDYIVPQMQLSYDNTKETLFVQGFNFGFEYNR